MTPVTYDSILPNIAQVTVSGTQVQVNWRCPATGRAVATSTATMAPDSSLSTRVGASVKRSLAYEVIYGIARSIAGLLGGAAGRILGNATYTVAADLNTRATANADYSEGSRRAAIIEAFESVRSNFSWDEEKARFVAR